MKTLNYFLLSLSLMFALSCSTDVNKFDPASYLGSRVPIPREIERLSDAPNRIIVLLDLVTCPSCELKSLGFWDDDLILFNGLSREMSCLDIIVVVNTERNDEIASALSRLDAMYPIKVFYDPNDRLISRFTPPVETQYHCFLVDKWDRIRLIGYPYMNNALRDKYISFIFGE